MSNIENKKVKIDPAVEDLSSLFKGGRISGWVERNRELVESDNPQEIELNLLLKYSPSFAKLTEKSSEDEIIGKIRSALIEADKSPLSATNFKLSPDNPNILIRK